MEEILLHEVDWPQIRLLQGDAAFLHINSFILLGAHVPNTPKLKVKHSNGRSDTPRCDREVFEELAFDT